MNEIMFLHKYFSFTFDFWYFRHSILWHCFNLWRPFDIRSTNK